MVHIAEHMSCAILQGSHSCTYAFTNAGTDTRANAYAS